MHEQISNFMKKVLLIFIAGIALAACNQKKECCAGQAAPSKAQVVYDNIMSRRSIRAYKPDAVSKAQMDTLLRCGINAPSAMNAQTWQVRAILNQDLMAKIRALDPDFSRGAPNLIIIAAEKGSDIGKINCSLLTENILLMANAMDLGTVVLGSFAGVIQKPEAKEVIAQFGLPENYEPIYAIAVGYPDESPDARERDASKAVIIE